MGEETSGFLPRFHIEIEGEGSDCKVAEQVGDQIMRPHPEHTTSSKPGSCDRGFSLIELLIVVAVILIVAAIAIPNFIRSRMAANEASAVQNLRNISTAEYLYSTTYGVSFTPKMQTLSGTAANPDVNNAELIDEVLASGTKSGYSFVYSAGAADPQGRINSYIVTATPLLPGTTGMRYFFTDQTCVIRWNGTGAAGPTDTPVQ